MWVFSYFYISDAEKGGLYGVGHFSRGDVCDSQCQPLLRASYTGRIRGCIPDMLKQIPCFDKTSCWSMYTIRFGSTDEG
jgi:hypothetical protein